MWDVRCFDTESKTFFDRHLILDSDHISFTVLQQILAIQEKSPQNRDILKFRDVFRELNLSGADCKKYDSIYCFCLTDYFEDQNTNGMDEITIMRHLTGQEKPIIEGNAKSILQLGPSPIKDIQKWRQNDSDILAHFIQVQRQIVESKWAKSKLRIQYTEKHTESATLPEFESLVYASIYFRQLYSENDKLFKLACDTYNRFVDNDAKKQWIKHERKAFDELLNAQIFPFRFQNITNKELIEIFLYGALIIHAPSPINPSNRTKLEQLLKIEPREKIGYGVNSCYKHLLNHVSNVALLIYKDYSYWLNNFNIPKPNIHWHSKLFGTYSSSLG
jgi:hypothetical protein